MTAYKRGSRAREVRCTTLTRFGARRTTGA
jgi:hypothetical protein